MIPRHITIHATDARDVVAERLGWYGTERVCLKRVGDAPGAEDCHGQDYVEVCYTRSALLSEESYQEEVEASEHQKTVEDEGCKRAWHPGLLY